MLTAEQTEAILKRQAARTAAVAHVVAALIAETAPNDSELLSRLSGRIGTQIDGHDPGSALEIQVSEDILREADAILSIARKMRGL